METANSGTQVQATAPRRRRRRRHRATMVTTDETASRSGASGNGNNAGNLAAPGGTAEGTTDSIGSSAVARGPAVTPRWQRVDGRQRVVCEGAEQFLVAQCPQCPMTPSSAAVVRAFMQAERAVLQCDPPANAMGRLPVRVEFSAAGVPLWVSFSGVEIDADTGLCVARALCRVRVPTFRRATATVTYDYVVLIPGAEE